MFVDSDEEKEDPTRVKRTAAGLKSLFASEDRSSRSGPANLSYQGAGGGSQSATGGSSGRAEDYLSRPKASAGSPPVPAQGSTTVALAGALDSAYKGDQPVGAAAVIIAHSQQAGTVAVVIDREKRHLTRVRVNENFQLLPNPQQKQYATLYDPQFGGHWMFGFKDVGACNTFVAGALTAQHFLLLPDGPRPPYLDVTVTQDSSVLIKKGDTATVSISVWLMQKKGTIQVVGKLVEEIVDEAPRRIRVGDNGIILGAEKALVGVGVGGRRLVFISPKETKQKGLGNPEISPGDSVVALVTVHNIEPYDPSLGLDDANRTADQFKQRSRGQSTRGRSNSRFGEDESPYQQQSSGGNRSMVSAASHQQPQQQQQQQQQQNSNNSPMPGGDTNALIQALLLRTLTEKEKPAEAPKPVAEDTTSRSDSHAFVERSLTMIQQQMSALYEKMDRLDLDHKLDQNNNKIERIVKKAVGKLPTLDVDVEDAGKDREELLAKIELLKEKAESHKSDYYAALETMGKHKDESVALKNDINIAVKTAEERIQELKERHRLELVDHEVRFRGELDSTQRKSFEDGKEKGYNEGFALGRVEGLTASGSASTEELREKLAAKESESIELQARIVEIEAKGYEDRRQALDQQQTLQQFIDRLEARNASKERATVDAGAMNAKFLRRTMNSAYSAIESQFYAYEKDNLPVADALNMVLIAIKQETRAAADELKRLAAIQAKEPVTSTSSVVLPFEIPASNTKQTFAAQQASEVEPPPRSLMPPPPPVPTSSSSSSSSSSHASSAASSPTRSNNNNMPPPPPPPPPGMPKPSSYSGGSQESLSSGLNLEENNQRAGSEEKKQEEEEEGSSTGNEEEDMIQKMLADYRKQRDQELAQEVSKNESEQAAVQKEQDQVHSATSALLNEGKEQEEEKEEKTSFVKPVAQEEEEESSQQQHYDPNQGEEEEEEESSYQKQGEPEQEEAEDEEAPVVVKKSVKGPKPPKKAESDEDDW